VAFSEAETAANRVEINKSFILEINVKIGEK